MAIGCCPALPEQLLIARLQINHRLPVCTDVFMSGLTPFACRLRAACLGVPRLTRTSPFTLRVPSVFSNRKFSSSPRIMSDLFVELTAPNGRKYTQPTGLFINNEFVKSRSGEKITTINPT